MSDKARIEIRYCTQCRWLLRAAWLAQELLTSFEQEIGEVALQPDIGGIFTVHAAGVLVWERKADGGFPDAAVLKQRVRDVIAPQKPLGHSDVKQTDEGWPFLSEKASSKNLSNVCCASAIWR
ncbi:SelT/SelW/SelH family protein [Chitinimonas sp. BJB300]|uniref:SelT/SelW/SelH family protein n=1 Tax=Chitinimonas sp. BJB300 TaxID=1559339 RepID=UPI000C10F2E3|nr:SelT/SelW/SelH family protein [Chitinimonas sp. BJB300]PHV11138.1 SelT/selW/selH domain protein [Chitinimonas sp. BJB300]TSJ90973.1 SelT/SelW/SelH family protein [Chitinimonas sp. BJB300]